MLAALGIVGFAYWSDYRADQQRPGSTAVQIDDTKYTLRYFTERLNIFVQQAGGPANQAAQPSVAIPAVTDQLVRETIVLRFADEMGVSASENDIKDGIATRLGLTVDDPNFDTRFQEELSRSGLTEEEYRLMIEAAVLTNKIRETLEAEVPASAESVHYRQILLIDQATAEEIKQQAEAGADFADLAAEQSLDPAAKDNGGDVGWVARGVLGSALEDILFALEPGEIEIFAAPSGVFVFQMLEKEDDREIEPDQRPFLAETALQEWLNEKRGQLEIEEFVLREGDKCDWALQHAYGIDSRCGI